MIILISIAADMRSQIRQHVRGLMSYCEQALCERCSIFEFMSDGRGLFFIGESVYPQHYPSVVQTKYESYSC